MALLKVALSGIIEKCIVFKMISPTFKLLLRCLSAATLEAAHAATNTDQTGIGLVTERRGVSPSMTRLHVACVVTSPHH